MEDKLPMVFGKAGLRGRLASGPLNAEQRDQPVLIELADGQQILVPMAALVPQPDGGYYLPLSPADVEKAKAQTAPEGRQQAGFLVVPVVQEELTVEKQLVETGRIRIDKHVREHDEIVDEPLLREEVAIRHVPINKVWEGPPPAPRYEGETYILPLLEEVLVVEKRLVLKEELHISRVQRSVHAPQTVVLRSEDVTVERVQPDSTVEAEHTARK